MALQFIPFSTDWRALGVYSEDTWTVVSLGVDRIQRPARLVELMMNKGTLFETGRASPVLRDQFLNALDSSDEVLILSLAQHLKGCTDYLPSTTCALLGLPAGSTYGAGARAIIER